MILNSNMYVPAIRWRQGEYQALLQLDDHTKGRIAPFITIPEIEFDFEAWQPKKNIQDHVHPFIARYKAKWGKRPAWIGVVESIISQPMDDGRAVFNYVFDGLRANGANAIPSVALSADSSTLVAVASIIKLDNKGVGISIRLEDLMQANSATRLQALRTALNVNLEDCDLLIDLGAPNFEPYKAFSSALINVLKKIADLSIYRNVVLIGTAMPPSLKDVAKGRDEIPRHDWMFYQQLIKMVPAGMRTPIYGDYTIVHPTFTATDMRMIKPAGKVVYTTQEAWAVYKGGSFRDKPDQMHDHCAAIVASSSYMTSTFSAGDEYIEKCAKHLDGPSNQTRWKNVGINHHITLVVHDLAKLVGST